MAKVSNTAKREIITQKSAFHEDIREIVAYHDEEGPLIEMVLAPEATEQYAELRMTPAFARELADELRQIADVAQRAGWTPAILAEARDTYLPGMTDEQIIEQLDRLSNRWGGFVIGFQGRLDQSAGRVLAVEVHVETLERAIVHIDEHAEVLSGVPEMGTRFRELRASLEDVSDCTRPSWGGSHERRRSARHVVFGEVV